MIEEHNHNQTTEHTYVFEQEDKQEEKKSGSRFLKASIILVILVILFFISVGIVRFVPKAISSLSSASVYLSSIFGTDKISLTTNANKVKSGDTVNFSWKNNTKDLGFYTWSFKCTKGVSILYRSIDGTMQPVICETKFPIPEEATSYPFVFNSSLTEDVKIVTTITLWDKETQTEKGSGSKTITLLPKDSTNTSGAPENTSTYSPDNNTNVGKTATTSEETKTTTKVTTEAKNNTSSNTTTQVQTIGASDLAISLIQASGIQSGNQNIIPLTNIGANDRVMLRFKVSNNGINSTGSWRLRATLPTLVAQDRNYVSPIEPSLSSGESHEMTMIFDSYDNSINQIVISVENVNDTNQTNNTLRIPISGSGSNNNNSNNGGLPDLAVKINSVGVLNRNTNQFLYTNSYGVNDTIAVKFDVENLGGQSTGYWNMKIEIPTSNGTYQTYGPLSPIAPGQKTNFTIGFDNPNGGNQNIIITTDYNNQISEYNNNNNSASQSIYINNYR